MKFSNFVHGLLNCVDLTITGPNDECGVRKLLNHIFPHQTHDYIQLQVDRTFIIHILFSIILITQILDNGLSNKLILVSCSQPHFVEPRKLLVKIYGQITNTLVDRTMELLCMHVLYEFRRQPQVHAVFNNGIAYSYIVGSTVSLSSLSLKKYRSFPFAVFLSLIASELAHFHSLPFRDAFLRLVTEERDGSLRASLVNQLALFPRLREWITRLPSELPDPKGTDRYISDFPTVSALHSEVNALETLLESACSPIVLCHNDLLTGNIIVSPDESTVSFIDLEYCAFGYAAFDIGNHFCEYADPSFIDCLEPYIDAHSYPGRLCVPIR
ncbi:ethanolamine kinase [Paragonimus westermani]|uniref:ethanolamine kinase n=1 Tax=Paragonimus westermani TaxID=34504 RepID=A0A5J4P149_9TREM|nr:ethanolamine kinase [Paragonimus westermani]